MNRTNADWRLSLGTEEDRKVHQLILLIWLKIEAAQAQAGAIFEAPQLISNFQLPFLDLGQPGKHQETRRCPSGYLWRQNSGNFKRQLAAALSYTGWNFGSSWRSGKVGWWNLRTWLWAGTNFLHHDFTQGRTGRVKKLGLDKSTQWWYDFDKFVIYQLTVSRRTVEWAEPSLSLNWMIWRSSHVKMGVLKEIWLVSDLIEREKATNLLTK